MHQPPPPRRDRAAGSPAGAPRRVDALRGVGALRGAGASLGTGAPRWAALWLLACAAVLLGGRAAQANPVTLLLSAQGGGYTEVADAIQAELRKMPGVRVVTSVVGASGSEDAPAPVPGAQPITIAVGTRAMQTALRAGEPRGLLLSVLVPRSSYETLTAGLKPAESRRVTAVHLDQPFGRQLELIRQVLPGLNRVGIVLGPESARDADRLQAAADARGLRLTIERANRDSELFPALQRVMADSDVFLAVPDARVVNADTAQNLLLTSFRLRAPVVAWSAGYVRAGALAAVFTTPAQAGTQAGELTRTLLRGASVPPPQYPKAFTVSINRQLARSLGLEVDDEAQVRERMQRNDRE